MFTPGRTAMSAAAIGITVLLALGANPPPHPTESQHTDASLSPPAETRSVSVRPSNRIPIHFEANRGQTNSRAQFLARGAGFVLFLTPEAIVLSLGGAEGASGLWIRFADADPAPRLRGLSPLQGKVHYFLGADPSRWTTDVPLYSAVRYEEVYPGIDALFYGRAAGRLEYDLQVAPGADPRAVVLAFEGAEALAIEPSGDLLITTAAGILRQERPVAYQERLGLITPIQARYVLRGDRQVALEVGAYDSSRPLVIDPVLVYSTYLGGSGNDEAYDVAADAAGNAYVTGFTTSTNFPVAGSVQGFGGQYDVFVTKFNPQGSALVYSTYLGGSDNERASGIVVDGSGNAYVTGRTHSGNFPTTAGAYDPSFNGNSDAFVTKLSASGSALVYSTFLGGSGFENGDSTDFLARRIGDIDVDGSGNAYVTGSTMSANFPTMTPLQPANAGVHDVFITKLNALGSALVYSTYLGGSDSDRGTGIAVDQSGNAFVGGETTSPNFPSTPGSFDPTRPGGFSDAFVAKVIAAGTALAYSTFLGGTGSELLTYGMRLDVDTAGSAYVLGDTASFDFPTTPGSLQPSKAGDIDIFVTKLNATGSALVYSTYLGGLDDEFAGDIAVNETGVAHLAGSTTSGGTFPVIGAVDVCTANFDAFAGQLNAQGNALLFSTCLSGSPGGERGLGAAVDASGNMYLTGWSSSTSAGNFPTTPGAFQTTFAGGATDAFVAKFGGFGGGGSCSGTGTFRISGRARTSAGSPVPGVTMTLSGPGGCSNTTTTNSRGVYAFSNLANGTYTVTPSKAGCTFTPASRTVTISGANVQANFTASCS